MRHFHVKSSAVIFFISFATIVTVGFFGTPAARAANPYFQHVYFGTDDNGNYIAFDWVSVPPVTDIGGEWANCSRDLVGIWLNRMNPDGAAVGIQLPQNFSGGDFSPQNAFFSGSNYSGFGNYGFASGLPNYGCATNDQDLRTALPKHLKTYINPNWSPERLSFTGGDFITIQLLRRRINIGVTELAVADTEQYFYHVPANPAPVIPYTNVKFGYNSRNGLTLSFDWVGPTRSAAMLVGFNGKITLPYYPKFVPDLAKDVSMIWENGSNENTSNINWFGWFDFQQGRHYDLPVNELHKVTPTNTLSVCSWWSSCAISKTTTEAVLGRSFAPDDYITIAFNSSSPSQPVIPYVLNDPNKYFAPQINRAPTLSFPADASYIDDGIDPTKGAANVTPFSFKVIYTDANNNPPSDISVVVTAASYTLSGVEGRHAMTVDVAASSALHDGNFTNGEQYIYTSPFPNGVYNYHFETSDGALAVNLLSAENLSFTSAYSSVAFLPGLEASRLYKPGAIIENQLWEPKWNADVQKLYMNPDGSPVHADIYARGVVDKIYGVLGDIYSGFIDYMNNLVADKVISEFETLPYDWRLQLDDVLASGASLGLTGGQLNLSYTTATTSPYIIQEIKRLARNSATGRVTLIGHSNGGLLTKRLMKKLADMGEAGIVDKIILVAVPQTGTPSALAAVLHGYDQELGGGYVLAKQTARTLAENMPSAYNLLPDAKYFSDVSTPVITFDSSSPATLSFRNTYGAAITSRAALQQFMLGADGRAKPAASNTDAPNILNSALMARARSVQDELDSWTAPAGVSIIQIAGWGANTLSAINYTQKAGGLLDYAPQFVVDGDGTVVVPSALAMGAGAEEYYVNIHDANIKNRLLGVVGVSRKHSDILEIPQLEDFISNVIQDISTLPQDIVTSLPSSSGNRLSFAVHSPVSLDLYDASGRHTGVSTSTNPYGDLQQIDEQIPNSYYMQFGEGQYAGTDGSGTTTVQLLGQSLGTFTFDVVETQGNTVVASTTFADIPVTASTTAFMSIDHLSSSTQPALAIDINGDGTTDATISAGDGLTATELIGILKGIVKTLHLPAKKEQKLLKELDKLVSVVIATPQGGGRQSNNNSDKDDRYSSFSKGGGRRPEDLNSKSEKVPAGSEDLTRNTDDKDDRPFVIARSEATKQSPSSVIASEARQSYNNDSKNESHQKHRTPSAFKNLIETIRQLQKKNLLTKDEADELIDILEKIKGMMVK